MWSAKPNQPMSAMTAAQTIASGRASVASAVPGIPCRKSAWAAPLGEARLSAPVLPVPLMAQLKPWLRLTWMKYHA